MIRTSPSAGGPGLAAFLALSLVPGRAVAATPDSASAAPEPVGAVTLDQAVDFALTHHPALAAGAWEIRARESEARQSGRRPNPELGFALENFSGSATFAGLDASEATVSLSQVLELGGKRAKRSAEAAADLAIARGDAAVRDTEIVTGVRVAFVELLAAQERTALADTLAGLADAFLQAVRVRAAAGGASAVDVRRATVHAETRRAEREHARLAQSAARARLAASWGSDEPRFERADGTLDVPADPKDSVAVTLDGAPVLARLAAERSKADAAHTLVAAEGTPDLTLGAGFRRFAEGGDGAFVLDLGIPLPIFDRHRDATDAARARIRAAERAEEDARVRLRLSVTDLRTARDAAAAEAAALRDRILPEAEAALVESREAYGHGRLRLTDVLDAQRDAAELRVHYLDVLTEYHRRGAELDGLLGRASHDATTGRMR